MSTRRSIRAFLAALLVAMGAQLVAALPASAGTLANVAWNISKPQPGDTAVRYTWEFTTATTGTVATITMSVPSGTAGATLTVTDNYGIGAGTAGLSGTTVTYTVTTPASVSSGIKILIAIDGFTNTSSTGTYNSTVTTQTSVPATIDSGSSPAGGVAINNNTTAVTVVIARSTTFTDSLNSFSMYMEPTVTANNDQTQPETLTVKSNAANGYSLNVKATTLAGTGNSIANVSSGVASCVATASFTADRRGYMMARTSGIGTLQGQLATAGNYCGYTTTGENAVVASGPTNSDVFTVTHRVKIDFGQDADVYTSTITYTVTETY